MLKYTAGVAKISNVFHSSVLIDTLLLRLARQKGVILPSSPRNAIVTSYKGAIVLQPPVGLFKGVGIFDMLRYYPSLIISFNISYETRCNKTITGFKLYPAGLAPQLCKLLLKERERLEEKLKKYEPGTEKYYSIKVKRDAVKYLVNAIYGYFAYSGSRLFDVDIASKITALGREGILKAAELFRRLGYKPLYADTDSIFVQIPFEKCEEVVEEVNRQLQEYFINKYKLKECNVRLKFERYCDSVLFFGVKKRYVAKVVWEGGTKCEYTLVKGMEIVRTDTSHFTKKFLKGLVELALNGSSRNEIYRYIFEKEKEFRNSSLEDIALHKGISKPFDAYSNKPPHIRGAILANLYLGCNFKPGDKVKMIYVKRVKGLPATDVICFDFEDRIKDKVVVDWERMKRVSLVDKAKPILKALGLGYPSSASLDRWLA
ncbi:MAG TPA: hypothetical protein ENF41_03455 [Candidatus Bathyarchaeota archaeon]|nr:hypothetical protein [Candidatus Bathyarchaeota archaeon]